MDKKERPIVTKLLKNCVLQYKRKFDWKISILFSWWKDSTLVAVATADAFPDSEIHLICMNNWVSHYLESAERQANVIKKLFPSVKIIYKLVDIRRNFRDNVIHKLEDNFLKDNFSSLLTCIWCKYLMHSTIAKYSLDNDIMIILDWFASRQSHYPEQTKEFMNKIKAEYEKINLRYESPIYDYFKDWDHITKVIWEYNVPFVEQQPVCIFWGSYSLAKPEDVIKYIENFKKNNIFSN